MFDHFDQDIEKIFDEMIVYWVIMSNNEINSGQ